MRDVGLVQNGMGVQQTRASFRTTLVFSTKSPPPKQKLRFELEMEGRETTRDPDPATHSSETGRLAQNRNGGFGVLSFVCRRGENRRNDGKHVIFTSVSISWYRCQVLMFSFSDASSGIDLEPCLPTTLSRGKS